MDSELWDPDDPLEPIMAAPEFRQPMYAPLRDISQELLLPGMELVEPNTVAVLETNEAFIEAYMVGLNHEMASSCSGPSTPPTSAAATSASSGMSRATCAGPATRMTTTNCVSSSATSRRSTAGRTGRCSANIRTARDIVPGNLVLLVRGELLRRYPNAVIYATEAVLDAQGRRALGAEQKQPLFRGTLTPDVTFFGFDLDAATASGDGGDEGWFFVFEPPPSEPRFGFEPADAKSAVGERLERSELVQLRRRPDHTRQCPGDRAHRSGSGAHLADALGGYRLRDDAPPRAGGHTRKRDVAGRCLTGSTPAAAAAWRSPASRS